jgi:hypothetical protein
MQVLSLMQVIEGRSAGSPRIVAGHLAPLDAIQASLSVL